MPAIGNAVMPDLPLQPSARRPAAVGGFFVLADKPLVAALLHDPHAACPWSARRRAGKMPRAPASSSLSIERRGAAVSPGPRRHQREDGFENRARLFGITGGK